HRGGGGHSRARIGATDRGAATGGATHHPQRSADTPPGSAGKAAALKRALLPHLGSTGRASFASAPIFPRGAHQRLTASACCKMEGEGQAVPIDRARVLCPLALRTNAAVVNAAEVTAPTNTMACGHANRQSKPRPCRHHTP